MGSAVNFLASEVGSFDNMQVYLADVIQYKEPAITSRVKLGGS